ncbi:MAG: hypothetical protein M3020_11485, partial [Myxococcota bacterium]|nr:hypothetical protein [Myxococcota bacterium]
GRGAALETAGGRAYPEQIKAALFEDAELARLVTGRFRLEAGARPSVCVECRSAEPPAAQLGEGFLSELERRGVPGLTLAWVPRGAGFAEGFERKQRYLE